MSIVIKLILKTPLARSEQADKSSTWTEDTFRENLLLSCTGWRALKDSGLSFQNYFLCKAKGK